MGHDSIETTRISLILVLKLGTKGPAGPDYYLVIY